MPGGTELRAILMYDANDDAKAGFRRIEVLTGPGRRRRWSADEKARAVAETLRPGATVSGVARRWQICPQQLFGWRRQALREGGDHRGTGSADDRHAAFVPLVMEAQPPPPAWCTDQVRSRSDPHPRSGSGNADIARASQLQHAVEDMRSYIDFGRTTFVR